MKKKIETDDVIYTIDENNDSCVDIDVKPGIEEVSFENSCSSEYLLGDCKKVFPNVRKIVIYYGVSNIAIPNTLFPNVKEVECHGSRFGRYIRNGNILIKHSTVTNTFIKKADEAIDLKYVETIENDSFSGCMSTKIINSKNVVKCKEHAFRNSAIGNLKPAQGGAVVAGSILVNIDEAAENIIIPDKNITLTAIRDGIDFTNMKSITVNNVQTAINLQDNLPSGVTVILKDKSYIENNQLSKWKKFPILELTEGNPYYATKDGCLLSKDGRVLVKCPPSISGAVHIPEGIETIMSYAFSFSEIEEVYFPDSMRMLMPECFYMCKKLRKVDFGHGIEEIGMGHNCELFLGCDNLQEIEVPPQVKIIGESAFIGTEISKVILHEGLTHIMD